MDSRIQRNRQFLEDLFAGPHPGHGIMSSLEFQAAAPIPPGDIVYSERSLDDWVSWGLSDYEARLGRLEVLDDDSIPQVRTVTGVEIFPAAFGCPVHVYDSPMDLPMALPVVTSPEEADRLPEPSLEAPALERVFEFAERMRERAGADAVISVPDMQSPFDIAAIIWEKAEFFRALYDSPDAVKRLVGKCHRLLEAFLLEFKRRFPNCTLCNYPYLGTPAHLGCEFAEDECGSISASAFEEFCLPISADMSNTFGGLFMHCCANADHQYENFQRIPNLRGLEYSFRDPSQAVETFSGSTVMITWGEEKAQAMLDAALPDSRFLFIIAVEPLEDARRICERLRARCEQHHARSAPDGNHSRTSPAWAADW